MSNSSVTLGAAIMVQRNAYYDHLESAQKSSLDITSWLLWFLGTLKEALEQDINTRKYQSLAKVSKATATRDLAELLEKGCLSKLPGGGRSTLYTVVVG